VAFVLVLFYKIRRDFARFFRRAAVGRELGQQTSFPAKHRP
jgi:hypothetical protein